MVSAALAAAVALIVRPAHSPPLGVIALPTLLVSPSSIDLVLHPGEQATAPLFITNTSDGILEWTVRLANVSPGLQTTGMRVLVERSHGQPALSTLLTDALVAAGAVVEENFAGPVSTALLAGSDAVILRDHFAGAYTPSEESVIASWLLAGGSAYMSADEPWAMENFTAIAAAAGAGFSYEGKFTESGLTTAVYPHPVTDGVQTLHIVNGAGQLTNLVSPAGKLADYPSGEILCVYSEPGSGRVVAAGEELEAPVSLQTPEADNLAFLVQAIAWAARAGVRLEASPDSGATQGLSTAVVDIIVRAPFQAGPYSADIEVRSPVIGDSVVTIPLSVVVTGEPAIAVAPDTLDFGETFTSYPKTRPLQVTNPGTDLLLVSAVYTTLPTLVAAPTTFSIAPGETAWVDVTFTPEAGGPIAGYVVIESNAGYAPVAVPVVGTGLDLLPPVFSMAPESLMVDLITGAAAVYEVAIANDGEFELQWGLVSPASLPTWLAVAPTAGAVAAADTDTVTVTFDAFALAAGAYESNIPIASNDPLRPEATLTAIMQVTGAPDIDVPTTELAFPDRFLGGAASLHVRAYNHGTDSLAGVVATAGAAFAVSPTGVAIPPGDSALYTVVFSPVQSGLNAGTLRFATNDPDEDTLSVLLIGIGVDPAWFTVAPESLRVALRPGESDTTLFSIHNAGGIGGSLSVVVNTVTETASPGAPASRAVTEAPALDPGARALAPWETAGDPQPHATDPRPRASPQAGAAPSFIFFDDFEDGDFDGWSEVATGSTREVTDESAAAGTARSYRESNSGGSHFRGIYKYFGEVQPREISFWIRSSTADAHTAYVTLRDSELREVVFFFASAAGVFYCNADVGGHYAYPYELDRWYHIELRNMDFVTKTFDYVVNDSLVKAGVRLRNASVVNDIGRMDLYSYSSGATAWWDEILVSYVPVSWLSVYPYDVTVGPGESVELEARFRTGDLPEGVYRGTIHVEEDRPIDPVHVLSMPVVLVVDSTATGVRDEDPTPRSFALAQNVPNPFNPATTIAYDLPEPAEVTLVIFDVAGRRVRTLVRGLQPAGRHTALWAGTDDAGRRVASGVYFYRLVAGAHSATRKMVMLR
jgi:hypothetical protein